MSVFDLKRATVKFIDGASTPNELSIKVGDGNVTFEEKRVIEYMKNRGNLDTVREGDQEPMDVSLDIRWEFLKGDSDVTPEDFLKKVNGASSYVSSSANLCEPYAIDIEIEFTPLCTSEKLETILLPDFRYESISHDAKASMLSVKGKCNATKATLTRTSQT